MIEVRKQSGTLLSDIHISCAVLLHHTHIDTRAFGDPMLGFQASGDGVMHMCDISTCRVHVDPGSIGKAKHG